MTRLRAFFGLVPLTLVPLFGCSAGSGGKNLGLNNDGGSSGSAGSGVGAIGAGGSSGTGTGGTASASGGTGGGIQLSGGSSGDGGSGGDCPNLTVVSNRLFPTVLILVDNSSSMFDTTSAGSTSWKLLYNALMGDSGPVKSLEDKIFFGFASYKGHQASSEDDPACATMTPTMSTFAFNNYDAIKTIYDQLGNETNNGAAWETPTGYAIKTVTPGLVAFTSDPPGPKYILLVTDGNPNTCQTINPQCGQDRTIKAVEDAYLQGVSTIPFGIGDIVVSDDGCNKMQDRCGADHLQDIANAGAGLPVQAPPSDYKYQPCIQGEGGLLTGTYAAAGQTPGMAPYFATNDSAELQTKLAAVLNAVQSCTFDLNVVVTGNPAGGVVTLGGNPLTYGDMTSGWTLEDNKYQVTLQGSSCDAFRANPGTTVNIAFPCQGGKPIAEPR